MADKPKNELPAEQDESMADLLMRYGKGFMREHPVITRGVASAVTDPLDMLQWLATHGVDPEVAMTMTPEQMKAQQDLASSLPNAGELASKYLAGIGVRESETLPEQIGELGVGILGPALVAKAPKALSLGKRILGKIDEAAMAGLPRMAGGAERGAIDLGPKAGKSGLPIDEASRMKRAEEMGFLIDVYHGTNKPNIKKFKVSKDDDFPIPGVSTTINPQIANLYAEEKTLEGANVLPLKVRGNIVDFVNFVNKFEKQTKKSFETATNAEILKFAKENKSSCVWSREQEEIRVFDPKNIRSRFAEFDPAASESADLLKAHGGAVRMGKGGLSRVNEAGNYTKPGMRKRLFNKIKASAVQGTKAGQWSARKAQLLAKKYKDQGGGYKD